MKTGQIEILKTDNWKNVKIEQNWKLDKTEKLDKIENWTKLKIGQNCGKIFSLFTYFL